MSWTLISPFKLNTPCKQPSVFSLMLNSCFNLNQVIVWADKHLTQQENTESNKARGHESTWHCWLSQYTDSLSPFINRVGVFKEGVESKKRKQVEGRVNSDEKTEQTSKEKKRKITWYLLVASPFCLVTFLTVMAACRFWYSEISKPKQQTIMYVWWQSTPGQCHNAIGGNRKPLLTYIQLYRFSFSNICWILFDICSIGSSTKKIDELMFFK